MRYPANNKIDFRGKEVPKMLTTRDDADRVGEGVIIGAEGQWVIVHQGKVIASDSDMDVILKLADKYPEEEVFITKVLFPGASFY